MKILKYYLIIINIVGFLMMFIDKEKAKKKKWRISEKNIFLISILGGSIGTTLGMFYFRHKTKHWYFRYGLPLIIIIQVILFFIMKNKIIKI